MSSVVWSMGPEPADLPTLSQTCYEGHLAGLRDAGWAGDERPVRLGFTAAMALRFGPIAGYVATITADDAMRARREPALGTTLDALLDRFAAVQPFVLDLPDAAWDLLASVQRGRSTTGRSFESQNPWQPVEKHPERARRVRRRARRPPAAGHLSGFFDRSGRFRDAAGGHTPRRAGNPPRRGTLRGGIPAQGVDALCSPVGGKPHRGVMPCR